MSYSTMRIFELRIVTVYFMSIASCLQERIGLFQMLISKWAVLATFLFFLNPSFLIASDDPSLEALLELQIDPLDWSSIYPQPVINQCTLALANKQMLKQDQVCRLHLLRGAAQFLIGKPETALEDLTELLRINPNDSQALNIRGSAYCLLGKYDKGQADFEAVIKLQPKSAIGYAYLAVCLAEKGDKDGSKRFAVKAVELDPDESQGYMARAKAYLLSGNYHEAIRDLNQCISLSFGTGQTTAKNPFGLRATVFLNFFDNTRKALPDLLMARRLDPSDNVLKGMFCEYYFKTGKYNIAFHLSERFSSGQNCPLGLQCNRANCLLERNRHEDALQVAESIIQRAPPWWGGYLTRGKVFFTQKKYRDALRDFDKSLSIRHDHFAVMAAKSYLLASCAEAQFRDGASARALATKCCERTEYQVPRLLMLLAMACAECGDYKEAVRWGKKSIEKADSSFPFLEDYRQRLALFEKGKPYRFSPGSRVFDYLW